MFFVNLGNEHVLAVLVPVAGFFPQLTVHHLRRADFFILGGGETFAHIIFQRAIDGPTIRMPEHHAGGFVLKVEQLQRFAEFTVVAFFRFGALM